MPYECPAGCGETFASENGAVMHAVNKSDPEHDSIRDKPTGYNRLEPNQQTAEESETRPTEDDSETTEMDSDNSLLFGSGGSDTDTEPDTETHEASEPECPDCGGELVDFTEYASGQYHEIDGSRVGVRGDYLCSECGGWFTDE